MSSKHPVDRPLVMRYEQAEQSLHDLEFAGPLPSIEIVSTLLTQSLRELIKIVHATPVCLVCFETGRAT